MPKLNSSLSLQYIQQHSYSWFLRNLLLPLGDQVTHQYMMQRLRLLEKAQWWTPERIYIFRDQLLREMIQTAYHEVQLYRDLFDQAKIKPDDIRTASDLRQLPIITKDILRRNYPHRTTRKTGQKTYEVCTSGSTGKNFCLQEDSSTAGWYRATTMLALEWAGWNIGEPHLQTGMTLIRSLDRQLKDFFLNCYYVSAYKLDGKSLNAGLELLEEHKLEHLWGYPGSLYLLAKSAIKQGWNRKLRTVVTWGDTLYPHYRKTIEEAFNTRVFDTYGCGEGFQISAQCGQDTDYHIHNLDVIAEFLDENGEPVSPGVPGRVIITRLYAGPTPLIRYSVGDIAIPGAGNCPCGRGFDLMNSIQGRDTDIIITPEGNHLIVHFFTGLLESFPEIDSFQVIQDELDTIKLNIVENYSIDQEAERRIIKALQAMGASDLKIKVSIVPEILLPPSGKRRFVINNLGAQKIVE